MSNTESPSVTIEGGPNPGATPDSTMPEWLSGLPVQLRPYASLARWDRPVGIWLLVLPCWIGLAFTRIGMGWHWIDIWWAALFFVGAVAMRGAGCTWNDITDQEIDASVARTAARPLPSGQVTTQQAYLWMAAQIFVGFLVWLCLPRDAKYIALLSIPLVAAYPFMKRYTWWPQAWLGMTFNWGVLVGAATVSYVSFPTIFLWFALIAWTIAYDTIYALQDVEDDELAGVKSTARLFGDRAVLGAFSFHLIAAAIAGFATWLVGAGRIGSLTMMAFLAHGVWQSLRLSKSKNEKALQIFKSNVTAGFILLAGLSFAAIIGGDRRTVAAEPQTTETVIEEAESAQTQPLWWTPPQAAPEEEAEASGTFPDVMRMLGITPDEDSEPAPEPEEETAEETEDAFDRLSVLPDWMAKAARGD